MPVMAGPRPMKPTWMLPEEMPVLMSAPELIWFHSMLSSPPLASL